jgi:hypothetical protein
MTLVAEGLAAVADAAQLGIRWFDRGGRGGGWGD